MSRGILAAYDAAGIGVASATYDIVGFPPLWIENGARAGREDGFRSAARPGTAVPPGLVYGR